MSSHTRAVAEVARGARAARRVRRGVRLAVTADTRPHPRELIACGELQALDRAMTALTGRPACHVQRVIELQIRWRQLQALNAIAVARAITQVTEATLGDELIGIGANRGGLGMVAAMAAIATSTGWQQAITGVSACFCAIVTGRAGDSEATHVPLVIEADGDALLRKDDRARPAIVRQRPRRAHRFGYRRAARQLGQPVHPSGWRRRGGGGARDREPRRKCAAEGKEEARGLLHFSTVRSRVTSMRKRCPTSRFMVCSHSNPSRPLLMNSGPGRSPAPSP